MVCCTKSTGCHSCRCHRAAYYQQDNRCWTFRMVCWPWNFTRWKWFPWSIPFDRKIGCRTENRIKSSNRKLRYLGTLSVDREEKIIFKPSLNADMLPSNYGLGTLHYSPFAESIAAEDRKLTITLPPPRKIARYAAIGLIAASVFLAAPTLNDARQNFADYIPKICWKLPRNRFQPTSTLLLRSQR